MPEISQDHFESEFPPTQQPVSVHELRMRANSSGSRSINIIKQITLPYDDMNKSDSIFSVDGFLAPFRPREQSDASMYESFVEYSHKAGYKRESAHR